VDDDNQQWRFSFIAIEYELASDGIEKIQTASKRFTYLFGEGAKTRTAQQRFQLLNKQSTLEDLKKAFAVEPLNKEFYDKLYKWYEKSKEQVKFPNDEKVENHIETSLIRFLTRILFVWFLKEKKLINQDLFDLEKLKNLIDYEKDSSFYKAIGQNLFFATLSVKIENRDFGSNKTYQGKNKDYGNQYVYRYQELVKDTDKWKDLFSQTPFLNGGLFDSLDRDATEEDKTKYPSRLQNTKIRMEGFSGHKVNPLEFDNQLLFNDNEQDLGLIDLFNQYQFTIEESTPLDIEVALDPELLGKVFEDLLATYNPETGEQARKATGSFYTPREIVSYMVDESLKQHFKTHTKLKDEQINNLFIESENNLNKEQIKEVITAIDNLKILDPAVGSGAYPMGILQRLVFVLEKIDPEAEHFKQQQLKNLPNLSSIEQDLKTAGRINDKQAKEKATEELKSRKQQIEGNFKNQDHNYLRKLHLIENCIYGVDIQPIAILITQLRFFISLTIEQEKKDEAANFGITPLPNLDYHFEAGNSLLGLPQNYNTESIQQLLTEIQPLKHQVFLENNNNKKKKLKTQIKEKINKCYQSIKTAIGYRVDFDFKIDFNEVFDKSNGFDIVIGNPPYIRHERITQWKAQFNLAFQTFTGTADIYTYFYEKGFNLLNKNGHLCYITSNKWMRAKYGEKLRYFFKNNTGLKQIIDFEGKQIFEHATVDTNILLCGKQKTNDFNYQKQLPNENNPFFTMAIKDLSENAYTLQPPEILALKKKIEKIGTPLKDWDISINYGIKTGFNEAFIIDTAKRDELIKADPKSAEIIRPILRGRDIKAYEHNWAGLWIIASHNGYKNTPAININNYSAIKQHLDQYYPQLEKRCDQGRTPYNLRDCSYMNEFLQQKIVYSEIVQKPQFYFDDKKYYVEATSFIMSGKNLKFLIALLHSKLITYAFKSFYAGGGLGKKGYRYKKIFLEQLPIPQTAQKPFIKLADKIIQAKQNNQDTTALETQIDKMVYQLYDLTNDEIQLIEDQ
jgi:type II restriction/modification system DNA methylase subunit YeeA